LQNLLRRELRADELNPSDLLTPDELAARLKVKQSWIKEQLRERTKIRNKGRPPLPCIRISKHVILSLADRGRVDVGTEQSAVINAGTLREGMHYGTQNSAA
jgi:hypothetical protein